PPREAGPKKLVCPAPLRLDQICEPTRQGTATWSAPITCVQGNRLVESPVYVAAYDHCRGRVGCPDDQIVLQSLIEDVAGELEHVAIEAEVIAPCDRTDCPQVVNEITVSKLRVGISDLSNVPKLQQNGNPGVFRCFHQ